MDCMGPGRTFNVVFRFSRIVFIYKEERLYTDFRHPFFSLSLEGILLCVSTPLVIHCPVYREVLKRKIKMNPKEVRGFKQQIFCSGERNRLFLQSGEDDCCNVVT